MHFPLARGLVKGRAISDLKFKHMFLYFDPHIAHDLEMLFCCADIKMRHAVNRAVGARVRASATAFEQFELLVNDDDFVQMLKDARADPKGATARLVIERVLNIISITGRHVPHSNYERRAEYTFLLAGARTNGAGSGMRNLAPDDVHEMKTIQYATRYEGEGGWPAVVPVGATAAMHGGDSIARSGFDPFDFRESNLQNFVARNPVASSVIFDRTLRNWTRCLIGVGNDKLTNPPPLRGADHTLAHRQSGIHGVSVSASSEKEENKVRRARAPLSVRRSARWFCRRSPHPIQTAISAVM